MHIGAQLGLTVPQLRAMSMSEYALWTAYFRLKNEAERDALNKGR